ncbi:MAG: type II secretory ATPase GspE/PulE/Tfp pilus assembly ATPase PilB-like protein [Verrucomicrobiales bacterium]|jgi:type II secretory ATPase GspE/PulE/Tfp pilus assembly ATPase PilB-like protein
MDELIDLDEFFSGGDYGVQVESLEASFYATLEGMIEHVHYNPFLGDHYFEKEEFARVLTQFSKAGMFPLSYDMAEEDGVIWETVTIALDPFELDQIKDIDTIFITLDDYALPLLNATFGFHNEITRENISFLALAQTEFRELIHYTKEKEERRQFILGIDDDTNGLEVFHALLIKAIKARASDIHIESIDERTTRVRYRIDGVLHDQKHRFTSRRLSSIISALKVDANLNISEKRKPQDGGIKYIATSTSLDDDSQNTANFNVTSTRKPTLHGRGFRVSTVPTEYGEKAVIRILNQREQIDLQELGFSVSVYNTMIQRIQTPHGIILVTGPTGSGKSTTLYSCLELRNSDDVNIVTIEDPVEISIPGINQSNVNRSVDWNFQNAIRAFLRQDPDIVLVGEIRDRETAQTAVEAAKTGHLVFSTLHTNDAIGALLRLKELEIDNSDLYTCMHSVLAQRLVRRLEPSYADEDEISERLSLLIGEPISEKILVKKPRAGLGIEESYGYLGRIPIVEIWNIDDEERALIFEGCKDDAAYRKLALSKGMEPLIVDGIKKVLLGQTSLAEVARSIPGEDFRRYKKQIIEAIRSRSELSSYENQPDS